MCQALPNVQKDHTYILIFFCASPRLLAHLRENGFFVTCILRFNQAKHCPLKLEKKMKSLGRGAFDYKVNEENNVIVC